MSLLILNNPSRKNTVKILTVGSYVIMIVDVIQGLVFVPLYLNYIGERLYGLWLGTGGILAVLAFLDMGMASLTIQRVSREFGQKNFDGVSKYFFGGILINSLFMLILLLSGIAVSLFLDFFFPEISIEEQQNLKKAFQIALIALILSLLNNTIEGVLNALQKALIGKVTLFLSSVIGILIVYFMLLGDNPLLAIPIGMFVRSVVSLMPNLIYLFILFRKNKIKLFNYDKLTIMDYLKLSPNLMLSKFGTSLVGNIEPTLINIFISAETAVYFSITKKGGGLIRMVLDRIGGILFPSMAHLYAEDPIVKFKNFFIKLLNYLVPLSFILFGLFVLFNKSLVMLWVGINNYLGDGITILIAFSLIFSFFSNFLSYLLATTGDIRFSSNVIFWESVTKATLLYTLLIVLGIIGIPLAITITSVLFCFVYLYRWNRYFNLKMFEIKQIFYTQLKGVFFLTMGFSLIYFVLEYIDYEPKLLNLILLSGFSFMILTGILVSTNDAFKKLLMNKFKINKYDGSQRL